MRVLGISAFYHDSAAALVEDGRVVAAAQEERFTRKKFDASYPRHSIDYCLKTTGAKLADVDFVSEDLKPRPRVDLRRLGEEQVLVRLAGVGLRGVGAGPCLLRGLWHHVLRDRAPDPSRSRHHQHFTTRG